MSRDDLHFRLRIPPNLKSQVEEAALLNQRSMTAEIVHRLELSFNGEDSIEGIKNRIEEQIGVLEQTKRNFEELGAKADKLKKNLPPQVR